MHSKNKYVEKISYFTLDNLDSVASVSEIKQSNSSLTFHIGLFRININELSEYSLKLNMTIDGIQTSPSKINLNNEISTNYIIDNQGNTKLNATFSLNNIITSKSDISEGTMAECKLDLCKGKDNNILHTNTTYLLFI